MNRAVTAILALFIGVMTLMFTLVLAIPLTLFALITGRKIEKSLKMQRDIFSKPSDPSVLEGEYEDVSKQ
ncbi:hypothetical protein [Vibrio sinaloensis]|uniref:hypothetical protein n=1 Tax=Photobacterium sp. (strain ATCC 43367) TaxID=379097 RepID=UPI002053F65B|nr:hypothetical protein [Vibrio sinaloensis]UPQ89609.1 hypothetical protein MTO69_17825 [Vibrio sinaloensis]